MLLVGVVPYGAVTALDALSVLHGAAGLGAETYTDVQTAGAHAAHA